LYLSQTDKAKQVKIPINLAMHLHSPGTWCCTGLRIILISVAWWRIH